MDNSIVLNEVHNAFEQAIRRAYHTSIYTDQWFAPRKQWVPPISIRKAVKGQMKLWHRPIIQVSLGFSFMYANPVKPGPLASTKTLLFQGMVTIPKLQSLEVIAAPAYMMHSALSSRVRPLKTYWRFLFEDPEMFDAYVDRLHFDMDMRRALKIPESIEPLPPEVTGSTAMEFWRNDPAYR